MFITIISSISLVVKVAVRWHDDTSTHYQQAIFWNVTRRYLVWKNQLIAYVTPQSVTYQKVALFALTADSNSNLTHTAVNSCVNFPGLRLHSEQFRILSLRCSVCAGGVVRGRTRRVGTTNTQHAATALERGCHTHRLPGHPPTFAGQHLCHGTTELGYTRNLIRVRSRSQSYSAEKERVFSPTTWTRSREVLERCRISWLQAIPERRSLCVSLYWLEKKLLFVKPSYYRMTHSRVGNH